MNCFFEWDRKITELLKKKRKLSAMLNGFCVFVLLMCGALDSHEEPAAKALEKNGFCILCDHCCEDLEICRLSDEIHHVVLVDLYDQKVLKQKHIEHMKQFKKLKAISLYGCRFQKNLIIPFEYWTQITEFSWDESDKPIPKAILEQVIRSDSLTDVSFEMSGSDLHLLTQMKSLKSVSLRLDKETDLRDLLPLRDQLLDLSISGEIPEDFGQTLRQFRNLRLLFISNMPVDVEFVALIREMDLAVLWLINTEVTDEVVPILKTWETLNEICICSFKEEDCKITPQGEIELRAIEGKKIWFKEIPFACSWRDLTEAELKGVKVLHD